MLVNILEKEKKNSVAAFLVWCCITFFYCYQCILRSLPNVISQDAMSIFNISAADFGSFSGFYYVGYVLLHIPIGVAITRFGVKIILPICIVLTSIGLIPLIYPISWNGAIIGRMFTGMGGSCAAVGALQMFRILYPDKFARMLGLMVSVGLLVAVYLGNLVGPFIENIGFKATLNWLLYSGMLLAAITYFVIPNSKNEKSEESSILSDLKSVILNYKLVLASLFAGLMVGPLEGFADAWGSLFLMNVYDIEKTYADYLIWSIFIGMSAGCILLPYIADKTKYYFGVTIFSGIVLLACFWYILTGFATESGLIYICVIIGVFSAYQVVILSRIATFVSEERSGIAGAVVNMIIMAFGYVFHTEIGRTLDDMWDGIVLDGVRQYNTEAFIKSINIIPNGIIVAVIGLSAIAFVNFMKDKKNQKNSY